MCNFILKVTPGWHQSICSVYCSAALGHTGGLASRRHPLGTALSKAPLVALLPSVQPLAVAPSPCPPCRCGLRFSAWQGPAGARSQRWGSADLGQGAQPQTCFRVTLRSGSRGSQRPHLALPASPQRVTALTTCPFRRQPSSLQLQPEVRSGDMNLVPLDGTESEAAPGHLSCKLL
ncbi:Golgi apparatus membrane protein TVP23 homolog A isoform X1 [Phocoena sinus]|uniref:Golgi apparatus membrane protein TVP23 homolog A isoform X1 n=1 Tax=Phocoena sinus TaxID=42100 RepID=UPI0013C52158|nr:Golgi apparatus membrane protein TVP23 homolog A isoform X1 [Phocoena sinus]